ncbi:MAG: DUF2332 family protein [Proteobacteria bacterium]|nr:DUF2332 family protein [Pseudomonadota bacterium]
MTTLGDAFRAQADACDSLGSPFMARLCTLLAERLTPDTPLTRRLFDWPGDLTPRGESVPLRLAGALHALVLQGDPLAGAYPPGTVDDASLWAAVSDALSRQAAFIDRFLDSPPQTNEVRRSAALIAVGQWLAARHDLPFTFSELGASAGLNLNWDRFALALGEQRFGPRDAALTLRPYWQGNPPPPARIRVAERAGVDLNPIDARDPDQRLRLLAYLWADQPERLALTEAALAAGPPLPERADAVDWLETRLAPRRENRLHLIWSTVAWQYVPAAGQARGQALIEAAGARATDSAPLAWFRYETDGATPGAGLSLRLWPGDLSLDLGRADFHGRWIDWRAP